MYSCGINMILYSLKATLLEIKNEISYVKVLASLTGKALGVVTRDLRSNLIYIGIHASFSPTNKKKKKTLTQI